MTRPERIPNPVSRGTGSSEVPRPFGWLLLVLAASLVVNTALGPLVSGVVSYPISDTLANQLVGLEIVTILLVAPWCGVAGLLALRNRPEASLLGIGPAAYAAYMFVQYVLGPEYAEYRVVTLFHVAVVTLSSGLMLWGWSLSRDVVLAPLTRRQRRIFAGFLLAMAGFTLTRYLGGIAGSFAGTPIPEEFEAARTFYWSIYLMDLGVVVPCAVVAGVALLAGTDLGRRGLYAVTGWFALVPPSVAAMALVMLSQDDPNASSTTVVILSAGAVAFAAIAVAIYRTLFTDATSVDPDRQRDAVEAARLSEE